MSTGSSVEPLPNSPADVDEPEQSRKRRLEEDGDPELSSKRVRLDPAVQPSAPQTNTTPPPSNTVIPTGNDDNRPYQVESTVSTRAPQSHVVTNSAVMGPNADSVHIRLLLDARQVGGLIGRGGASISQIRQACFARIHIDQQISGATTRLATVNGSCDQVILACQMIVDKIAEESSRIPPHNLTILVEEKQCGCVIGRAGREIADARAETQANIHIPVGTLPRSTEKTIEISGPKEAVFKAIQFVVSQLAKNPHHADVIQVYDPATEAPQAARGGRRGYGVTDMSGYGLYQTVDGGYVTYQYPQAGAAAYYIQPEAFAAAAAQWPTTQAGAAAAAAQAYYIQQPPAHERGGRYPYQ